MLKPGRYRYYSFPGEEPREIELIEQDGQLIAHFPATEDDDGADLLVSDLAGRFEPVEGGGATVEHVDHSDLEEFLQRVAAQVERGEITAFAVRYQDADGNWHDVAAGYESEEAEAAALAKLHRVKGHLN